jgi:glycine cleavage system H protein
MSKRYFTEDHEWLEVNGGIATVGITEYAQEQLGDIVFVELPEVGQSLGKGDAAVVVESVKAASDVYAPVSGEVTETNTGLSDDPGAINRSAEKEAWLWKMSVADESELEGLMDEAAYRQHIS